MAPLPQRGHRRAFLRRLEPARLADIAFGAIVLLVVLIRFRILRAGGAPATIDAGNWLAFGDGILGRGVRSPTIVYPPVVPLLTTGSVGLLGLVNGVAAVGAIGSVAPGVGVYWVLRRCRLGFGALLAALLVLGASAVGEAASWGGFPQLIGLGLTPVLLWYVDRLARTWRRGDAFVAGVVLAVLLATSHLIGSVAALAAVLILLIGYVAPGADRPRLRTVPSALGWLVLPSLWLLPLYGTLVRQVIFNPNGYRSLTHLSWGNLLDRIQFVFRDLAVVWWPLLIVVLATPFLLFARRHHALWRIATALLAATTVLTAVTREGRYLYVLTVIAGLYAGLWLMHAAELAGVGLGGPLPHLLDTRVAVALAAVVAILAVQIAGGLSFFRQQRDFYGILSPDLVKGIEQVTEATPPDSVMAVTSLRDAPLGWWVEAIGRRPTIYSAPLRWLAFDDEIDRAQRANVIFRPPFPDDDGLEDAREAGIDLILVPTEWVFFDEEAIDALAAENPGAVDYINSELVVIRP